MSYRDELAAAQARIAALERDIAALKRDDGQDRATLLARLSAAETALRSARADADAARERFFAQLESERRGLEDSHEARLEALRQRHSAEAARARAESELAAARLAATQAALEQARDHNDNLRVEVEALLGGRARARELYRARVASAEAALNALLGERSRQTRAATQPEAGAAALEAARRAQAAREEALDARIIDARNELERLQRALSLCSSDQDE